MLLYLNPRMLPKAINKFEHLNKKKARHLPGSFKTLPGFLSIMFPDRSDSDIVEFYLIMFITTQAVLVVFFILFSYCFIFIVIFRAGYVQACSCNIILKATFI